MALPERLEKFIEPEPNSGCWLWVGWLSRGYPYCRRPRCRIRSCVNPAHLRARGRSANASDGAVYGAKKRAEELDDIPI